MTRSALPTSKLPVTPRRARRPVLFGLLMALMATLLPSVTAQAIDPDIPPAVDPGTPTYTGAEDPVPDGPVPFDPTRNMLQAFHDADVAAGGDSFWIDRLLERPAGGNGGNQRNTGAARPQEQQQGRDEDDEQDQEEGEDAPMVVEGVVGAIGDEEDQHQGGHQPPLPPR